LQKINQGDHKRLQGQAVQAPAQRRLYRVYNIFIKLKKLQKINQGGNKRLQGQAVQAPAQSYLNRVYKIFLKLNNFEISKEGGGGVHAEVALGPS
jgi:hypothetical protein